MSGKAALILVVCFSIVYLLVAHFWTGVAKRSVENHVEYYTGSVAHNIAVSGANIELNKIYLNGWSTGSSTRSFENGTMTVTDTQPDSVTRVITSVGIFMSTSRTVKVKSMRASFAKYAWFTGSVSSSKAFITGDTIWGGMHSNQTLNIKGSPVFFGKVTTSKGINPSPSRMISLGFHPQFLGGYGTGVEIPFNNTIQFTAQRNAAQANGKYFDATDIWLTFNSNGTVTYRTGKGNDPTKYSAPITTPLTTLAPNGLIYVNNGDVYMSGTLKGNVTVVAEQSSGIGGGNAYFVNDMLYSTDPMLRASLGDYVQNDNCTDELGVLVTNNAFVATSTSDGGQINNVVNKDINIDAGIFCSKGGLTVEDWKDVPAPAGIFTLKGSMTAGTEENIAKLNNNYELTQGYKRRVIFDERFHTTPPLYFPLSNNYDIVSWLE